MGRTTPLLLLAAILATTPAGSATTGFEGEASLCHATRGLNVDHAYCPSVRHQGTIVPGACAGPSCEIAVSLVATGQGLPTVSKSIASILLLGTHAVPLCSAESADWSVGCIGEAAAQVALADGACTEIRIRSSLRDLADVPPHLHVQADNALTLCRNGAEAAVTFG